MARVRSTICGAMSSSRSTYTVTTSKSRKATWFARVMVLVVFCWNVLCALQFIIAPASFASGYGLEPTPENCALVSGIGVAFLMWNVTYPAVIFDPMRFKTLYIVVLIQQLVGLAGEYFIWMRLSGAGLAEGAMADGIMRFVIFDGVGLAMMLVGLIVLWLCRPKLGRY